MLVLKFKLSDFQVLYKLAKGEGELYDQDQIEQSWGTPCNEETFRTVTMLIGCDYVKFYCKLSQSLDFQKVRILKKVVTKLYGHQLLIYA